MTEQELAAGYRVMTVGRRPPGRVAGFRWSFRMVPHHAATWLLCVHLVLFAACARPPVRPAIPAVPGAGEVGLASWYGPDFHGRRTSSGEVYDMHHLTAAHRELPLGTWILVTNLENGRSVELRVNDRGPFVGDRIVDVSYAAGRLLGMIGPGVVPVRLTVTQPAIARGGIPRGATARFAVQAGSFNSLENARAVERSLAEGFPEVEVVRRVIGAETYFRVWVGNFPRRSEAQAVAERLAARGLAVLIIERDR